MHSFLKLLFPLQAILSGNANERITLAFILTILIYATVSTADFLHRTRTRRQLIESLGKAVRQFRRPAEGRIKHELEQHFAVDPQIAETWQEFQDSLITRTREGREVVYKTEESALYFNEDNLVGQYMNVRYWNALPSLLVGLGILGTFVGLTLGLVPFSTVDFTETREIQHAIQELLSGVSIAFTTSVWGMLTSILFNWFEKRSIGQLGRGVAELQHALDQLFTLTTQEEIEFRQQDELEQQTQALKSFSTDLADRLKVVMDGVISQQQSGLQDELRQMHQENEARTEELIQQLNQLGDRIDRGMQSLVREELRPVLAQMRKAVDQLRDQKAEASTEAIERLVTEFQQLLAGTTVHELEILATTLQGVSSELVQLPTQVEAMRHAFSETSLEHRQAVADIVTHVMEQASNATSLMKQEIEAVSVHTEEQVQRQLDGVERMFGSLTHAFNAAVVRQTEVIRQLVEQVAEQSTQTTATMREQVEGSASVFAENIEKLAGQVDALLTRQATQAKEVNALVENSRKILGEGRQLVGRMADGAAEWQQVLGQVEAFAGQLNAGAERLDEAGQELITATHTFRQQNESFAATNRETVQRIESSLEHAQTLLGEFAGKFGDIEQALTGIFGEVQQGLTTYAVTTRESINQYLSEFSQQLVQAANALAGSIEALEENIDELSEVFEKRRGPGA